VIFKVPFQPKLFYASVQSEQERRSQAKHLLSASTSGRWEESCSARGFVSFTRPGYSGSCKGNAVW